MKAVSCFIVPPPTSKFKDLWEAALPLAVKSTRRNTPDQLDVGHDVSDWDIVDTFIAEVFITYASAS